MNFLAHAFLARDESDLLLGSLMGDFVKGPLDGRYAPSITRGLILHRGVDTYTDAHAIVARSRARVGPIRRRYAGILVDLFYDHYLARYWSDYAATPLDQFTASVYATLLDRPHLLPERLRDIAPHMASRDWLGSYRDIAAVGESLDRIGTRLKRGNALLGSVKELIGNYASLEADFRAFFPDVVRFAQEAQAASACLAGSAPANGACPRV
jgi:acyl carrier protein phosphodiesterase